ncbi:hypothetical protein ACT2E5_07245 [Burkholderia vietnamiensis]|uniref:hypothetical protein n=1 Tax=Burkholderia vietnamiensis TaxID=60552 RepID=UPI00402AA1A5
MSDDKARAARFLAQFEISKKSVASWPNWMRESAKMVAASLPESRTVKSAADVKSERARKR